MKKKTFYLVIFAFSISLFACKKEEKLPPAVSNVGEAKKLIMGKTWKVVDVATVSGSASSSFDTGKSKTETVITPILLEWFSDIKGIDTTTSFSGSFYREQFVKFKKISLSFNKDSVATCTGMDMGGDKQIFSVNDDVEENKPKGIKLTLAGSGEGFAGMSASKFTATYYILGANQNKLYLLTPNKMNSMKVVILLESK